MAQVLGDSNQCCFMGFHFCCQMLSAFHLIGKAKSLQAKIFPKFWMLLLIPLDFTCDHDRCQRLVWGYVPRFNRADREGSLEIKTYLLTPMMAQDKQH